MPTTAMTPTAVSTTMWRARAPATSTIPIVMATNTSAVPRSGWSMISATGRPSTASAAKSRRARSGTSASASSAATARMAVTLASSAGWSWKAPIWNHACVPRRSLPSEDTTSASSTVVTAYGSQAKSRRRR